jgi:hypothetical protein
LRIAFLFALALLTCCAPEAQKVERPVDAVLAQNTVKTYFSLISQRKYGDAYRLWGNDGADTRGTIANFAASFEPFDAYTAEVGDSTEIKATAGTEYITVATTIRATRKQTGAVSTLSGPVMLRRAAASGGQWRIWGTDIRVR